MSLNNKKMKMVVKTVAITTMLALSACGSSSYTDAEYFQLGNEATQVGDRKTAIIQYKNAIKTNPQNVEARLALAAIYLAASSGVLAEKEIDRAGKIVALSDEWVIKLAEAKLMQGKFAEAEKPLSTITNASPMYPASLALQGDIQLASLKYQDAQSSYKAASKLDANNIRAIQGFARLALVDEDYPLASNYLEKALAIEPKDWRTLQLKAGMLFIQKKYSQSAVVFDEAILHEGAPKGEINQNNFVAYMSKVKALMATDQLDRAQEAVNGILKQIDKHPAPHHLNGVLAYQRKEYKIALDHFQKVLSISPKYSPVYKVMGATQYILGDLEQANLNLTRAINAAPGDVAALKLLGAVRMKLGESSDLVELLSPLTKSGDADAQILAMIGRAAITEGQMDSGLNYLKQAVKAKPSDSGIRSELIRAYLESGDFDQAINELENLKGNSAKAMIVRANLAKGDKLEAERVAKKLLADEPENPAAFIIVGVVQQAKGEKNSAKVSYSKAIEKDNKNIVARQLLAGIAFEDNRDHEAGRYFSEIIAIEKHNEGALLGLAMISARAGEEEKALAALQEARYASPKAVRARMMLANYFFKKRELNEVATLVDEMKTEIPNDPKLLLLQANLAKVSGNTEEALRVIGALIEKEPAAAQLYFEKAGLLLRLSKKHEAKTALKKAINLAPDFLQAKTMLAVLELDLGNDRAAMMLAEEMQKKAGDFAAGYVVAGDIYFKQKKYKKAQSAYQKAFERASTGQLASKLTAAYRATDESYKVDAILREYLEQIDNVGVRLALAVSLQSAGQLDLAEKEYLSVLEKEQESLIALNNLAYLSLESNLIKARQYAEKAYSLAPQNALIVDTLGWIYWKEGDASKAEMLLKEALDLTTASMNPDIAYHYAVVLAKRGAKELAISQLEKALKSKAYFEDRDAASNLLSELD